MKQLKKTYDTCATLDGAELNGCTVGQIRIQESAIVAMVKKAALSVPGVTRISGSSLLDNLAELVGSKRMQDRAVLIRFSGCSVSVEISLNVLYGSNIPGVAGKVQKNITNAIVENSGLTVSKVNVNIRDLEEPAPAESAAGTEEEDAK